MITQQQIDEISIWGGLKDFTRFVLSHCEHGGLPDYKKMDLLQVPKLVPNIWVWDLREFKSNGQILMNFSGRKIDDSWGFCLTGKDEKTIIKERYSSELENMKLNANIQAINNKCAIYKCFDEWYIHKDHKRQGNMESLFFPCSSDGKNVNWGIGCLIYQKQLMGAQQVIRMF